MQARFLALALICVATIANAQVPEIEWVRAIGGSGNERANSIASDQEGKLLLVGRFQSPEIQLDHLTLTKNPRDQADVADLFIVKLDPFGKAIWAISAGDKGDDHATGCTIDSNGNGYVVGWFESDTLRFGKIALTKKSASGCDMFVAKFSSDGECLWAHNAGGQGGNGDYSSITLDRDANVVVSGIAGVVMDFGNAIRFSHEKSGMYLAKYSKEGELLWAKSPKGQGEAQGVGTDPEGNVFIGGFFNSSISFDALNLNSHSEQSGDAFVAKYSPTGNALWALNFGGDGGEIASCEADPFGNVYLAGLFFSKTISKAHAELSNKGLINAFIAKFDAEGKLLWANAAGGNNGDAPATAIREFHVDHSGNAYCTGSNWSEFTFAGEPIQTVSGSEDILLLKYSKDGEELWGVDYGGSGRNAGRGITTDPNGNILLTGSFDEKALQLGTHTLFNSGDSDIFIVKFKDQR